MDDVITGSCLCGAVRYQINAAPKGGGHCQCRDCQKDTGTGHSTHVAFPANSLEVSGTLTSYEKKSDGGNLVTRGFCTACGSPILLKTAALPELVFVTAGTLDEPSIFRPSMVMFTRSAAAWDVVDPGLRRFETTPT